MSHFTVLVVTKSDCADELKKTLQPYHEYECTGIEDEYVRFVPAEEGLEKLQAEHREHLEKYPDSTKQDFGQWIEEWHGYELRDGVWGRFTNPDKKWDWWTVGGRWSGALLSRCGKRCDQARKSDVDFDAMLAELAKDAGDDWDAAARLINGDRFESWDVIRERLKNEPNGIEKARERYWAQPAVARLKKDDRFKFSFREDLSEYLMPRDQFVRMRARRNVVQFAVLWDGTWHERGRMGWWAVVHDEQDDWEDQYEKLVASIPADRWLTVVDCHI